MKIHIKAFDGFVGTGKIYETELPSTSRTNILDISFTPVVLVSICFMKFAYTFLPWTINNGNRDDSRVWNLTGYHQYAFIQGYTFGYLNYQGMYKYNIGYKYLQYSIPCAQELINYHEKDNCIALEPSYLTFKIVPYEIPVETESESTIKRISLNKKNYKQIYSIKFK